MTTIAFSPTHVAYDSQETSGNMRRESGVDKVIILDGNIYGCAGDADCCEAAPAWHACGARLDEAPAGEWEMIVVSQKRDGTPEFKIFTNDQKLGFTTKPPAAVGSGGRFAISGMTAGMSASEAVQHAAVLDIFTGGTIKTFSYEEAFLAAKAEKKRVTKKKTQHKAATVKKPVVKKKASRSAASKGSPKRK